jgi:hypothetical protein
MHGHSENWINLIIFILKALLENNTKMPTLTRDFRFVYIQGYLLQQCMEYFRNNEMRKMTKSTNKNMFSTAVGGGLYQRKLPLYC